MKANSKSSPMQSAKPSRISIRLFDKSTTRAELEAIRKACVPPRSRVPDRIMTVRDYMGHSYPPARRIPESYREFLCASRIETCAASPLHGKAVERARKNRERIARELVRA
jgi:hypothetical protein